MGRTEFLTETITSESWLESATHQRERNGALLRVHAPVCSKSVDTADIVRDGDLTPTHYRPDCATGSRTLRWKTLLSNDHHGSCRPHTCSSHRKRDEQS